MTHTKDMLAEELRRVGLSNMADRAATGYYHDFLSPLDFPEMALLDELRGEIEKCIEPSRQTEMMRLSMRCMTGEFDATAEESEDWAKSPEGQETFGKLLGEGKMSVNAVRKIIEK